MQTRLDNRQHVFADTIHKSGISLLAIINDILDFSKIEVGKLEMENASFDLQNSIDDVAALLASKATEKKLELIVRYQPNLPTMVVGDAGRMRQVITNLLSNAIKFTETGHVLINVEGREVDSRLRVRIEVQDTGIGIDEQKKKTIFEAFQQADITTTREYGGTGLGLSISQSLISAMGGTMGVESELNKGSSFWIDLIFLISDEEKLVWDLPFDAARQRVLVVDDNKINRQIIEEQLFAWGFTPSLAESGEEALQLLDFAYEEEKPFTLAILDHQMPGMDGQELAQKIRDDVRFDDIKLLALSSVDCANNTKRMRKIGVNGCLVKPVRGTLLYETTVNVLTAKSRDEEIDSVSARESVELPVQNPVRAEKIKILAVEDNSVNQLVIKHMLDPNQYELVLANNGREGVDVFKNTHQSLAMILMDVSMPEMDGYQATRAIRDFEISENLSATPIICLTAHVMESDILKSEEAGMDDFLSKPVSKDKLYQAIERWSEKKQPLNLQAAG